MNTAGEETGSYKEYQESTTITLEWTVRNLKQLFDSRSAVTPPLFPTLERELTRLISSSKGDQKSKVTKSAKFGGG